MDRAPTPKQLLLGGGHLAALWALAFVQPLLDLLGKNPDFFVARGNSPGDILLLAIGFTVIPPLVLLAIEAVVVRFSATARNWLHLIFIAGITTFFFIQVVSDLFSRPTVLILLVAIGLAVLFAWAAYRFRFLRNLLDILIVAPAVILALFIFASPASDVIFPGGGDAALAADSGGDHPVVLIVFDELGTADLMTDDRSIDRRRFPNFARLADEATWYRNQSTTAFFTPKAVPGILTGKLAPDDALATADDQPDSIFTLLGKDRPLHVMEPATAICPDSLCPEEETNQRQLTRLKALWSDLKYVEGRLVLPPGLADRLPDVGTNFEGFGDADEGGSGGIDEFFVKGRGNRSEPEEYRQFIRDIPDSRRGLTMMHLHLPHQPWRYDRSGRQYNTSPIEQLSRSTAEWLVDDNGIASAQARMYTQTGFADQLVGEVRRDLVRKGLWDDAIVVVTADHGVSFEGGEVPQRMVDRRAMGEVANPPLFIKYPGQKRGEASDEHSMTLDIVPTIAQALDVKDPYEFDGFPLQGPVPDRPIAVKDIKNRETSVELPEMVAQRDAAIKRANRRLGKGPIYTLGPAPQLIGRPAPPVPEGTTAVALDNPGIWDDYRPRRRIVPMNVTGVLESGAGTDLTIAVGVNGRIAGTAGSFEFEGANRFGTLIDPSSLVPGRNEITVYAVDGDRLVPLGGN